MVALGTVKGGVIVLDEESGFHEGDHVAVIALPAISQAVSTTERPGHSVLDIPTFSVGRILKPFGPDDDILGEMLDEHP